MGLAMIKIKTVLSNLDLFFSSIFLFLMSFLVLLQIYMRYVTGGSLAWSEELVSWSFLYMAWFGVSAVYMDEGHISVGYSGSKPWSKLLLSRLSLLIQAVFYVLIIYYAFTYINKPYILRQKSVVLSLLIWYLYIPVIASCFYSLCRIIAKIFKKEIISEAV